MILDGNKVAENIKDDLSDFFSSSFFQDKYIAIFLLSGDESSLKYVEKKKKFGEKLGLPVVVLGNTDFEIESFKGNQKIEKLKQLDYSQEKNVFYAIEQLNKDENCVGIMVQLPLREDMEKDKLDILVSIAPEKDIDGLSGQLLGYSMIEYFDFLPATPQAVLNILSFYNLLNLEGKNISVIGQSNIVGKPLSVELMRRYGEVFCFNYLVDQEFLKDCCRKSDYIISATGKAGLVDSDFIRNDNSQILIDVGYKEKEGEKYGDIVFEEVKDKVKAITPVPGGVGPVTVATLFQNVKKLLSSKLYDSSF